MATVVDALIVTLGLDRTQFNKEQEAAAAALEKTKNKARETGKEMERSGDSAAAFFRKTKNEALALFGVRLGGKSLEVFAKDTTRALVGLGQAAGHLGTAVPQLDAFSKMIGRNGGKAEEATAQFIALHDAMMQFALTGQSPIAGPLLQIGASRTDNAIDVAKKYAAFAQQHPALAYQIGHGLGFSDATIEGLKRSSAMPGGIAGELDLSVKLGVANKDMIESSQKLRTDFIKLGDAVENASAKILLQFQPMLSLIANALTDWVIFKPKNINDPALTQEAAEQMIRERWQLRQPHSMLPPRGSGESGGASLVPPAPGTRARAVMEELRAFYKAKGMPDHQIAGILVQASAESGFNPDQTTMEADGLPSYGLFQHHKERLDEMIKRYGRRPTVQQQAQFFWDEMHSTERRAFSGLSQATTPQAAGVAGTSLERPADLSEYTRRGASAYRFLPDPALNISPSSAPPRGGAPSVNVGDVTINTTASTMKGAGDAMGHALAERILRDANRGLTQ